MTQLRADIDSLIASGSADAAYRCLAELWRTEKGPAAAAFVVARAEQLRDQLSLLPYRLAILRSFTVEPVVPLLRASAFFFGIDLTVQVGDFNAYAQEILDRDSSLYRFSPDAVVWAVRTADIASDLWQDFAHLSPDDVGAASVRVSDSLKQWVRAFRERSKAAL